MNLAFEKYEGLGNDFVIVETPKPGLIDAQTARHICDRHFGVGADGVLLIEPPRSGQARASMVVLNADGTRPEMCGNGLRCAALHLARHDGAGAVNYAIDTDAGSLACGVERDGDRAMVTVAMGRGRRLGTHTAEADGRPVELTLVSMGNPHAIAFDTGLDAAAIDRFAPRVSSAFPEGTNVELATTIDRRQFDLIVWERGVGRTLACGTGAAATAVAAAAAGRAPFGEAIVVRLPGGPLELTVEAESLDVSMRGPARRVFSGRLELP